MKGLMNGSKLGWLVIAIVLAAGGCVVESPQESPQEVESALELGGINLPPTIPQLCYASTGCSLTYLGGYQRPLQQQLGCSQTYRYMTGGSHIFLGGLASYCPNTPAIRSVLRNAGYRIYGPGYCNDCLDIPATQIFVFWVEYVGPGCPSSCGPSHPPVEP